MFDDVLIESAGKDRQKGGWITMLISTVIHLAIVGAIIAAGAYVKENPEVIEKPIAAFMAVAPPPPPPPPPGPSGGQQRVTPKVETPRQEQPRFQQPRDTPRDVPVVNERKSSDAAVEGGQVGGQKGGVRGGVVGGDPEGVLGGVVGGVRGGQLGSTGTGDTPVRVGGNVKAPVVLSRIDPVYHETARRARIEGIVIVEAVIDRQGNVTEARVLKPLPLGLDQSALAAVKQWKFHPGTLNGQPVPVYFNLVVNFKLNR